MKIAIIGSGAAALGVLDRLSTFEPRPDITLFDRAEFGAPAGPQTACWTKDQLRALYRRIKTEHGNVFPPPKTNFGVAPSMRIVEGWGRVWDSALYGGLTNIWGLSAIPFSDRDLKGWPYGRAELDPHYAAIAERIGIAGRRDALTDWLDKDFVNRPPVATPPLISKLRARINSRPPGEGYRFIAGASRLALETRPEAPNACVLCGECMIACPRSSMYSTVPTMEAWRRSGLIARVVVGRALGIDRYRRSITMEIANGRREVVGPFDRIYVCAGCLGTTEIVMRTLDQREGPRIADGSVYTFLLVHTGPQVSEPYDHRKYLALTNLLVNAVPVTSAGRPAQLQIYLISDHLWRYFVPTALWPVLAPLGRALRRRAFLVRVFLHGDYSQSYAIHVDDARPARLSLAHCGTTLRQIPDLWQDIGRNFGGGGFFIPPVRPARQSTSSHYAASLPLGAGPVAMDGSIAPGIYICNSSVFPTAPAASPTFTIMANARRIADLNSALRRKGRTRSAA